MNFKIGNEVRYGTEIGKITLITKGLKYCIEVTFPKFDIYPERIAHFDSEGRMKHEIINGDTRLEKLK